MTTLEKRKNSTRRQQKWNKQSLEKQSEIQPVRDGYGWKAGGQVNGNGWSAVSLSMRFAISFNFY